MNSRMLILARADIMSRKLLLFRWLVRALLIIFLILAVVNQSFSRQWFGLFFIILPLGVMLDIFRLFLRGEVGRESTLQAAKPVGATTFETASLLVRSRKRSSYLWFHLLRDRSVVFVLNRLGVPASDFAKRLTQLPDYAEWLKQAQLVAKNEQSSLKPKHLFEVLQGNAGLQAVWDHLGITREERDKVWQWYNRLSAEIKASDRGFVTNLTSANGIGRDWSSGYTNALSQYAADLTRDVREVGRQITLVGHREERDTILKHLARDERHNVVIIGEDGIGKQRLLYALASDFISGKVPGDLQYKHIYQLEVGQVINGGEEQEIEARLTQIFNEAEAAGNVVLVVPDFQLLVGATTGKTLGIINAAGLITTYLQRPGIQIIAALTPSDYYTYVKPNAALAPYLQSVEVHEIASQDALIILEDEVFKYEAKAKKQFTYQSLVKVIEIADRHVHDKPYPEKALQLLEEVSARVSTNQPIITARDVEATLSQTLKVPLGQVSNSEKLSLTNLEETIKSRIVGQLEAVKVVANSLRRARSGLTSGKRPIGTFLFLGPTGVGKTEMAKTIAELYYKNPKAMIRLDMSEYQSVGSVEKLVGTRTQPGLLTTAVVDQPFSVVLLDEIEKAEAGVRNLFLQILDAGRVTDGYGKTVDFTNTMVIATSNAGAQMIRDAVEQNQIDSTFKPKLLDWIQDQGIFAPEWINRFDATVVFLPLNQVEIRRVAQLQVAELAQQLTSHNIELTVANDVYDLLVEKGFDPEYGARPMRRAIQDLVENALAKLLLNESGEGKKQITLTRQMLEQ